MGRSHSKPPNRSYDRSRSRRRLWRVRRLPWRNMVEPNRALPRPALLDRAERSENAARARANAPTSRLQLPDMSCPAARRPPLGMSELRWTFRSVLDSRGLPPLPDAASNHDVRVLRFQPRHRGLAGHGSADPLGRAKSGAIVSPEVVVNRWYFRLGQGRAGRPRAIARAEKVF